MISINRVIFIFTNLNDLNCTRKRNELIELNCKRTNHLFFVPILVTPTHKTMPLPLPQPQL